MRARVALALTVMLLLLQGCTSSSPGRGAANDASAAASRSGPASSPPTAGSGSSTAPTPSTTLIASSLQVAATVVTGLTSPWGLAFLPEGGALVSQRDDGQILLIREGTARPVGTVDGVVHDAEGGLLGIAVSPTFATDRYLYAYYGSAMDNRIVRMTVAAGEAGLGPQQVVVQGIEKASIHNGGRIAFGPDGMLYAGTGDAGQRSSSQNAGSLNGKILRMTPDGRPAPGNPDPASLVYSLGHRNVQGLAFDAAGRLWASEFGQNTWDELNLIVPGGNYGWPEAEGTAGNPAYRDPIAQWSTGEASPSGIAVVGDAVVMTGLRGARLWVIPVSGGELRGEPTALFTAQFGRLRTVAVAPDGSVWLMTNNTDGRGDLRPGDDRILRLAN